MKALKTAVIGAGHLGKYHAEKYHLLSSSQLTHICDTDKNLAEKYASQYDSASITDYHQLIGKVNAVSIVTPSQTHFKIAKCMLENNIHVLLEKPMTTTLAEADALIALAEKNQLVLQIGHIERYNPTFNGLLKHLNKPKYIEANRVAPFSIRNTDVPVTLDLMIHSIDLILSMVNSKIKGISAIGTSVLTQNIDIANARIEFTCGTIANITASRVSFSTKREMRIFQHNQFIQADFQNKLLSIHQKGDKETSPGIAELIATNEVFDDNDALLDEINDFLDSIIHKKTPLVTGEDGRNALATAIKINQLINEGEKIE